MKKVTSHATASGKREHTHSHTHTRACAMRSPSLRECHVCVGEGEEMVVGAVCVRLSQI